MKIKNIITIAMLAISLCSFAQTTITVEQAGQYIDNKTNFPTGTTRVEDTNHVLDPFVGTWTGLYDGNIIEFTIYETTITNRYDGITYDDLSIAYKVTSSSGITLFDSSSHVNSEMSGRYLSSNGYYYLTLPDLCGNHADVLIKADYSDQSTGTTPILVTEFTRILVFVITDKELLNVEPPNCMSITAQFSNRAVFTLNKI